VIDMINKNADYRRPMSRINLLDTRATTPYSVCCRQPDLRRLARRPFHSDSPQLSVTLPDF
jgi:hypothetical protein